LTQNWSDGLKPFNQFDIDQEKRDRSKYSECAYNTFKRKITNNIHQPDKQL